MKKVFQKNIDKDNGDCVRAVMASLFEMDYDSLPLFKPDNTQSFEKMNFFMDNGYPNFSVYSRRGSGPSLEEVAKFDKGVGGYFYASVPSQTYPDINHAVIVDRDLKVVHDPNPNQLALKCKPEDVQYIVTTGNWLVEGNKIVVNRRGKTRVEINSANDYNDICNDMLSEFLESFTQEKGLLQPYDPVLHDQFEEGVVKWVYTQRGMQLYDRFCIKLKRLGDKYFDYGVNIDCQNMIEP